MSLPPTRRDRNSSSPILFEAVLFIKLHTLIDLASLGVMFPFGGNAGPFGNMQSMMNGMMSQMMQDPYHQNFQRQMQVCAVFAES